MAQMVDRRKENYRILLLRLSKSLTITNFEDLKFLCGDIILTGEAEAMTRPLQLFEAFEKLNKLSVDNVNFLASKLGVIGRIDLKNELLEIQGKNVKVFRFVHLLLVT